VTEQTKQIDASTRSPVVRWTAATALFTGAALVLALAAGHGAPQPAPPGIPDPGALTGWGLPFVRLVSDLAGMATIGLLVAAAMLLPSPDGQLAGLSLRSSRAAGRVALAWSAAAATLVVLTVSDFFAVSLGDAFSGPLLTGFIRDTSIGQALVAQCLLALAVWALSRWTLTVPEACLLLALAALALVPPALTGHSAAAGSHNLAVVSLLVHVAAASLWVGGLIAVGWIAVIGSRRLSYGVRRFSVLAAWCLGIIVVSGVVNAGIRLGGVAVLLTTGYGALVLVKAAAAGALGYLGWRQRRHVSSGFDRDHDDAPSRATATKAFLSLAAVELTVMAMTVAVAVALARTPPPPVEEELSATTQLLGTEMPAAPSPLRLLNGFYPDGVGITLVLLGAALYVKGLAVLRRRGDRWPIGRSLAWGAGLALVGWSTFGGLGLYAHVLFSAHMVSHMVLSMVAPILLVLGAPVTLALRTLPGSRVPGEVGPRQLLVSLLHSRPVRLLTHPLVAIALFIASLYGIYFSGLFELLMTSHTGHVAMELHFLLVGCLFFYVLVGVDPAPRRLPQLVRFAILLFTLPFHAFFSVALMSSDTLIGQAYWTELDRPYQTDLLADQYLGGGASWAMGELPLVVVLAALFVQWLRSDRRDAARSDRAAARTPRAQDEDTDELDAYNAYLARLAGGDQAGRGRRP